ncbi:LexA family protein [Pseudomonas solani]|uniref:LexA family protein n=1 Tax=Pseudomonas solani TaxID=2731552 RepID=UPI003C2AF47D
MGNVRIIGRLGPSFAKLPLYTLAIDENAKGPVRLRLEGCVSLDELLGIDIPQTFTVRLEDDSMDGMGLVAGDLLLADRSRIAVDGSLVVAVIDGDFYIRRLRHEDGRRVLLAENARYPALNLSPEQDWMIRGVVTHSFRRPERWQPLA